MKAIVYIEYESPEVLQFKEVEKPTPKDDEVLVKIYVASANALDWHLMRAAPFLARLENGLRNPKIRSLALILQGALKQMKSNRV